MKGSGISLAVLGLAALAGCGLLPDAAPPQAPAPSVSPVVRPAALVPPPAPRPPAPSQASRDLAQYYARLQNDLLVQGLLRGDGGGPDTPFTDTQLARNFIQIALFNEYADGSDFSSPQATSSLLRRWEKPVRLSVVFGASVNDAQQAQDIASVRSYVARLARLTGLSVSFTDEAANFHVLFMSEDDRRAAAPLLRRLLPGVSERTVQAMVNLPREQLCVVVGTFGPDGARYDRAVAIIRAEHPSLMRTACIHEELAQALGLANDSPQARPSIFNDDEEFARLTTHDELLLRMLYDRRMRSGMLAAEAAPVAARLATEYLAGNGS